MSLPVVRKKVVWRIGGPEGAGSRPSSSMEGLGMSVSEHPEAWRQIARLRSGDTWRLTPKPPRRSGVFLDVHALSREQVVSLNMIAMSEGLLRLEKRWKAMWAIEEDAGTIIPLEEDYHYAFYDTRKRAEIEAESASPDGESWAVGKEDVHIPTKRLLRIWGERFTGPLPDGAADRVAWQVILERDEPSLDGFWWNDELDPDGLSAPRGMIFYSRVGNWNWKMDHGKRMNSDTELRGAGRAFAAAGDLASQARLLVQRMRAGELDPWIVRAAVSLEHPGAAATGMPALSDDEREWTDEDREWAHRHGFDVFQTGERGLEIEALDEPPEDAIQVFDGEDRDSDAHHFVLSQARLGNRTAIKALLEVRDQRGQDGVNFERPVVMVGQPLFDWLESEGENVSTWYDEDDLPLQYRKAAERAAIAVELDLANVLLGLPSSSPNVHEILRSEETRHNGWWRAVHRYVSPRERALTPEETRVRDVAYGIKHGDTEAIATAAEAMSRLVPSGAVVVPAPSSRAGSYGGVSRLAVEIAKAVNGIYAEPVGRRSDVPSSHARRRLGGHGLDVDEHVGSMIGRTIDPCPEGRPIVVIDNVAASGATLEAVRRIIGPGCDVMAVVWAEALPWSAGA